MDIGKSISFLKNSVTRDSGFSPVFIANMDILIGYAEEQLTDKWIPVSEKLPEESDVYLATFIENEKCYVERFYYSTFSGWLMPVNWQDEGRIDKIIAWKPLPEPYKEKSNEG